MTTLADVGSILPSSVLQSEWFAVLATFVALNTVMYCALAVAKMLPKLYASDLVHRRNRRRQNRSIYPDGVPPGGRGEDAPRLEPAA